ncbi:MAG TPA: 2'-deoxycytidine 5'-triphosphate deaminase, partial [Oceanicaulis sp.]|nr:2'-deoxycytidine 5'-triphosphate deaminase [Oceanicaulis sp.]
MTPSPGILPDRALSEAVAQGWIASDKSLENGQIQPASL